MERNKDFNNFYGEGYEELLPRELVDVYEVEECLSCADGCDTLLLKQKSTGKKMVAKCYTGDSTLPGQTEDIARELAIALAEAMKALHTSDPVIIHRDIKPENFIWNSKEEKLYLVDCDSARFSVGRSRVFHFCPLFFTKVN